MTRLTRAERRRLERVRAKARLRQPYLEKQVAAIAADPSLAPRGAVTIVTVMHDARCPRPSGGLCRCDPDLAFETLPPLDGGDVP